MSGIFLQSISDVAGWKKRGCVPSAVADYSTKSNISLRAAELAPGQAAFAS
jgi:hypothetical protein